MTLTDMEKGNKLLVRHCSFGAIKIVHIWREVLWLQLGKVQLSLKTLEGSTAVDANVASNLQI